jgi:hypothetical protein
MGTFKNRSCLFAILALAGLSPLLADDAAMPLGDLPPAVAGVLKQHWPQGELRRACRDEDDGVVCYEVDLVDQGQLVEVKVWPTGELREVERHIDVDDLPATAREMIQAAYPNSKLQIIEKQTRYRDGKAVVTDYEIELVTSNKEVEFVVTADGKIRNLDEDDLADDQLAFE